jgi:hypothetical protein
MRSNQRPDTLMQDRISQVDKASCTARPDHTSGSNCDMTASPRHFRSSPDCRHSSARPTCRRSANRRPEQVQQIRLGTLPWTYSITSSARASSVGGTSSPSVLAVLRLITSSYFTGACTGRSAGLSPFRMRLT